MDSRQHRRPSTVADNALSQATCSYLQQIHQNSLQMAKHSVDTSQHLPQVPTVNIQSDCTSLYPPMSNHIHSDCPPYITPPIDNTYNTSAESGLEMDIVDMEICESDGRSMPKPPLARRHTLTAMTGIVSPESMLRTIGGPSIDSGNSMELPSQSPSIESNLDYPDLGTSLDLYNNGISNAAGFAPGNHFGAVDNSSDNGLLHTSAYQQDPDPFSRQRHQTRSPVNFREGRRASDGLVCQDVIAFRQKLKDGMKAGGMLELRQEHSQLMESHSGEIDSSVAMEPPVKIPLGKRMSLPTNSIDLPPHKLLEIKKSIQLDQNLADSQDLHEATHPFGALRPYDPMQLNPLHRQHSRAANMRNNRLKQQSALYQQFQQMHIEQTSLGPSSITNIGRNAKHPPVARQPSYKLAQQQTVMPPVLHGSDVVPALPWPRERTNFALDVCISTSNGCIVNNTQALNSSAVSSRQRQQDSLCPSTYPLVDWHS